MYVFDNAAPIAGARLAALAAVHDPASFSHLAARGVTRGWHCLEIGGGLGTITRWLSERVGPEGRVLTTDIDTRFLDGLQLANVEVRRHDIQVDPLPAGVFDIAYARLVLEHLPDPDTALDRMVAALKPGGWLLVEDLEVREASPDAPDPLDRGSRTAVVMRRVAERAGIRLGLAVSLPRRFRDRGLVEIGNEGRVRLCRGNSTDARLSRLNFEQLREPILATGEITPAEFDADLARLDDEDLVWRSPTLWAVWGRRSETAA